MALDRAVAVSPAGTALPSAAAVIYHFVSITAPTIKGVKKSKRDGQKQPVYGSNSCTIFTERRVKIQGRDGKRGRAGLRPTTTTGPYREKCLLH